MVASSARSSGRQRADFGRRGGRARRVRVVLAAAALASLAASCSDATPTPSPVPPLAGLAVLAGEPGSMRLSIHDPGGDVREATLPALDTAWITGRADGSLVALLDRSLHHSSSPGSAEPGWQRFPASGADLPEQPLALATWSPDGSRVAVLAAAFDGTPSFTLVATTPPDGPSRLIPIPEVPAIAAPVWLDDRRVLVQTEGGLVVVDVDSGGIAAGPPLAVGSGRPIATAPAGRLVAIAASEAGAVDILDLDAWLAGSAESLRGRVEGTGEIGAIAFDAPGERLAVVWQQLDGPGAVVVYGRTAGWQELVRFELAGESAAAVVTWLN